jgi:hypothetical protein
MNGKDCLCFITNICKHPTKASTIVGAVLGQPTSKFNFKDNFKLHFKPLAAPIKSRSISEGYVSFFSSL